MTATAAPAPIAAPDTWSLPKRLLFRFFFCYWTLWALPANGRVSVFTAIPGMEKAFAPYIAAWHAIVHNADSGIMPRRTLEANESRGNPTRLFGII